MVLNSGKQYKASDLSWMDGYIATIPRASGGIKFLPVSQDIYSSVPTNVFLHYPYFLSSRDKCLKLFGLMKRQLSNNEFVKFFRGVCAYEEFAFWTLISNSMMRLMSKVDSEGKGPSAEGFNIYSENKFYRDVTVRIAQCVWICDVTKREEVAKILLLAGVYALCFYYLCAILTLNNNNLVFPLDKCCNMGDWVAVCCGILLLGTS
jgi:hypothetical protein